MTRVLPLMHTYDIVKMDASAMPAFKVTHHDAAQCKVMQCEVSYSFKRLRHRSTPLSDAEVNVWQEDGQNLRMGLNTNAYGTRGITNRPETVGDGLSQQILDAAGRFPQHPAYGLFLHVSNNSFVTMKDKPSILSNWVGDVRIIMGDGYAFYLIGHPESQDPEERFAPASHIGNRSTEIAAKVVAHGQPADVFVGVTLWGDKTRSHHGRLALSGEVATKLPRLCNIPTLEVLPPLWGS
jgi:hypothetical protein